MKTTHSVYAFVLAALLAGFYAAPASAGGGRSGALASLGSQPQTEQHHGSAQRDTQAQIDLLRKELAELKAQMDNGKTVAANK